MGSSENVNFRNEVDLKNIKNIKHNLTPRSTALGSWNISWRTLVLYVGNLFN